jgi:hypothetical protein
MLGSQNRSENINTKGGIDKDVHEYKNPRLLHAHFERMVMQLFNREQSIIWHANSLPQRPV